MRVWIVAALASRDLDLLRGGLQHRLRLREGGLGRLQLRRADVELALRAGALLDQLLRAVDLDLGELDLALLLDDRGLGDRQLLLRGRDARLGLGQLRLQRDGVQPHQHLARLDQVAFVDEDLLDPQRFLGGDVDQLAPRSGRCPRRSPPAARPASPSSTGSRRTPPTATTTTAMIHDPIVFEIFLAMSTPYASPACGLVGLRRARLDSRSPQLVRSFISSCVASGTTGWPCAQLPAAAQRLVEGDQVGATDERVWARVFCSCSRERCASSTRW